MNETRRVMHTALVTAAIEYAQRLSEPYLFNHAMRSWLFAETDRPYQGTRLRPRSRRDWHDPSRHRPAPPACRAPTASK